ncbi:hypothetical protein [Streptomyces sp. NPDC000188]|uniref:hypothetical protein n=1 Tax=Streptomyces sp. NPDC000188 TaxID=3154245 RepID=UPI0033175FF5
MLAIGRVLHHTPRSVVMHQDEPSTHVLLLLRGWTEVTAIAANGYEALLALRGPGEHQYGVTGGTVQGDVIRRFGGRGDAPGPVSGPIPREYVETLAWVFRSCPCRTSTRLLRVPGTPASRGSRTGPWNPPPQTGAAPLSTPTSSPSAPEPVWREVASRAGVDGSAYQLWVEESDDINAMAATGHIVGVASHSLGELPTARLDGVLAHELGATTPAGTPGCRCSPTGTRYPVVSHGASCAGRPRTSTVCPSAWPPCCSA